MKNFLLSVILLSLSGCGVRKTSDEMGKALGKGMGEAFACMIPTVVTGTLSPVVVIGQTNIDNILRDLQGRTFNRKTFWTLLSRKTRIGLNLTLNNQMKVPEEILYPGVVLFMENYLKTPGQNYFLRASHSVRFAVDKDETRMNQTTCENQDEALKEIDVSRVVPASTLEQKLNCGNFSVSFYKNHVLLSNDEQNLFSRGEVIRTDSVNELKISALDPDQQTLSLILSKKDKILQINFTGKTQTLSGTYRCSTEN